MVSNLPPGVSERMIPGSTPDDERDEAFWVALDRKFEQEHGETAMKTISRIFAEQSSETVERYVLMARDIGYDVGAADTRAEAQIEEALRNMDAG